MTEQQRIDDYADEVARHLVGPRQQRVRPGCPSAVESKEDTEGTSRGFGF